MLKKLASILILVSALFTASYAHAQLGFMSGLILGNAMSDGSKTYGNNVGMIVLYEMPQAQERIRNPLEIRMVNTGYNDFYYTASSVKNLSLQELFRYALGKNIDAAKFELIQVALALDPRNKVYATVWFFYIEKNQLTPLTELPQKKN